MTRLLYSLLIWISGTLVALGGPVMSLRWATELDSILIGAPLPGRVEVILPDTAAPDWTGILAGMVPFELLQADTLPVEKLPGGIYKHSLDLKLICFETGIHRVGPLTLAKGTDTLYSNILSLRVTDMPVDTTGDIRPIVPPLKVPLTWQEWLVRIGIGLGILALVALLFVAWKRWRKKKAQQQLPVLDKPVKEWALEELGLLESTLPAQIPADIKQYYDRLSYIMRVFIHYQYGIPAMELTSREIAEWAKDIAGYEKWSPQIMPVIREADLAKFAKATPGETQQRNAFDTVKQWVLSATGDNASST